MFRTMGLRFVHAATMQIELQLALIAVGYYNCVLCQRQARDVAPIGFRQKAAMPVHGGGRDILYIEPPVRELFVEDARPDLQGTLCAAQPFCEGPRRAKGGRPQPPRPTSEHAPVPPAPRTHPTH